MSIYFSKLDPLGATSSVAVNFEKHCSRKTHLGSWGSDKHARNLYPRGKAYDKMWSMQFQTVTKNIFDT